MQIEIIPVARQAKMLPYGLQLLEPQRHAKHAVRNKYN